MQEHKSTVDKDGKDVSTFIAEAVESLRDHPGTWKVLCCHYRTGRLQVWAYDDTMDGDVIHQAIDAGYKVDFVKERSLNPPPSRDSAAYMELLPAENQ